MCHKTKAIVLVSMIICVLLVDHEAHASSTFYVCSEAACNYTVTLGYCSVLTQPPVMSSEASYYCGGSQTVYCNTIQFTNIPAGTHYIAISGCGYFEEGTVTVDGSHSYLLTLCPVSETDCCTNGGGCGCSICQSQPPTATTLDATSVTSSTATLNASVNPNGSNTTYYFQYGKTSSYGYTTSSGSAGSGTSSMRVSSNVANLSPETTYHCRIVATNDAGTTYGQDKMFTTTSIISTSIFGIVTDASSSQPIEGAKITSESDWGSKGSTTTFPDGSYILPDLDAGKWIVTAEADGYETTHSKEFELAEGEWKEVDLQLSPVSSIEMVYVNQYDASCNGHSPCHTSIQEAIDASSPGAIILVTTGRYNEDLTVDNSVIVTLQGGWNDTYSTRSINTEVRSVTIGPVGGSLTVDGINYRE